MTPEEIAERDPVAIQRRLLEISEELKGLDIVEKQDKYLMAKAHFEVAKTRGKLLEAEKSSLQSVLKSLGIM